MLTAGFPAASQTSKWDYTYQHNQSGLAAKKQPPGSLSGTAKPGPKRGGGLRTQPKTSKSLGMEFKKIELQGIRTRDGK